MTVKKFIKELSETYFSEKNKSWQNSRRCWSFIFASFFGLYLFQIYAADAEFQSFALWQSNAGEAFLNAEAFWQTKVSAIYFQGIVLSGIFIRFAAAHFRGKWFARFGELGELVGFAALVGHFRWTVGLRSGDFGGHACYSSGLAGMIPIGEQIISLFFLGWIFYKIFWLIAVTWKTVRK